MAERHIFWEGLETEKALLTGIPGRSFGMSAHRAPCLQAPPAPGTCRCSHLTCRVPAGPAGISGPILPARSLPARLSGPPLGSAWAASRSPPRCPRPVITQDTSIPPVCPLLSPPSPAPVPPQSTSMVSQASGSHTHKSKPTLRKLAQLQEHRDRFTCPKYSLHPTARPSLTGHCCVPSTRFYPPTPNSAGAVSSLLASSCGCKKMFLIMIIPGNYTLSTS